MAFVSHVVVFAGVVLTIIQTLNGVRALNALLADWKLTLSMAAAALAAVAMVAYAFLRPAVDMAEAERKRRLHLNQIGRIAEGQIVELAEHPPEPRRRAKDFLARAGVRSLIRGCASWCLTATQFPASPITLRKTLPALKAKFVLSAWLPGSQPA